MSDTLAALLRPALGLALGALALSTLALAATGERVRVYVGTYTDGTSRGIYRFDFDPATGSMSEPVLAVESKNPSFLALHPSGRFLYAVGEISNFEGQKTGAISAFTVEARTGDLVLLNLLDISLSDEGGLVARKQTVALQGMFEQVLRDFDLKVQSANLSITAESQGLSVIGDSSLLLRVLENVVETIRMLKERGIWVEIVTLVVPGFSDDPDQLKQMADFLACCVSGATPQASAEVGLEALRIVEAAYASSAGLGETT